MTYRNHQTEQLDKKVHNLLSNEDSMKDLFEFAPKDGMISQRLEVVHYSYWRSTVHSFLKNKIATSLMLLILLLILFTFIQPHLPKQHNYQTINNDENGKILRNIRPNHEYWFGTNSIGQDLWSNVWAGTRTSLVIGITVAIMEGLIGIFLGVLWGYFRKIDWLLTEVYNILDNVPQTIVLILFSYLMKPSINTLVITMCFTGWIGMARFIRNQIVLIRDKEYNIVSRCLGTPVSRIIRKNLLPYLVSVITLRISLTIPAAIGNEVFITYIGLGLQTGTPSLGNLVNSGRALMMSPRLRYQLIFPSVVLSVITVSFYIIGNAFADASDPKNHV